MLSNKFLERVLNSVFLDTKKYRYTSRRCHDGTVAIIRLPIQYLNTTKSLTHWELVKYLK